MLNLNKKWNLNLCYTSKIHFFKKFKHNLKLETFDHITFLYKVHELLLIIHKASAGFL